jgi:hypothetical protein
MASNTENSVLSSSGSDCGYLILEVNEKKPEDPISWESFNILNGKQRQPGYLLL